MFESKSDHECRSSRAELVGLEGPSPDDRCEMQSLGPVFFSWTPDRENLSDFKGFLWFPVREPCLSWCGSP